MSQFVKKATSKISKMSDEQILRLIDTQTNDIKVRNLALDNSYVGYLLIENNKTVSYVNKQLATLIPVFNERIIKNSPLDKFIINEDLLSFFEQCLKDENTTQSKVFEFDDPGSGKKYINCMSLRLKDFDGILFTFTDVTYFHRFKDEFRKNETLASMTTMAAGVAHEIKNPLASISIYLQLLDREFAKKGSIDKNTADKYLSVVKEEVDRLNSIAVDFLFAVKPMKVNLEKANLNDICLKVVKVVSPELEEKGISLDLRLATSLPNVMIDISLMQQAILNLIKNAMQAIDNDAKEKSILLSSYIDGEYAVLSVADTGCGMTNEQMEKIFEPYFTTKSNGTGLGLTVLFKIIKEFGGEINVHSQKGHGSEFVLRIPIPRDERYRISYNPEETSL